MSCGMTAVVSAAATAAATAVADIADHSTRKRVE